MIPTHSTPAYRSEQRRSEQRRAGRRWRLMTTTALVAAMNTHLAIAQDATWTGAAGAGYALALSWNPNAVPTGTATFGVSPVTLIGVLLNTTVGGWDFTSATAYTFVVDVGGSIALSFNGAGITGVGSANATINNDELFSFLNSSSAGSATIINSGFTRFLSSSTAGSATINNTGDVNFFTTSTAGSAVINNSGNWAFTGSSTAGSAMITNGGAGNVDFSDASSAGSAMITNGALLRFFSASSAANAMINNNGVVNFYTTSTAGNATVDNSSDVFFNNSSTAGNATITNNRNLDFLDASSAGSARIDNNNNVAFRNTSTASNATINNMPGGIVSFFGSSAAGGATINNNGDVVFTDSGTAGNAVINNSGVTRFFNTSTGGNATIVNNTGGIIDFNTTSSAGSATINNTGDLRFLNSSTGGNAAIVNNAGGTVDFSGSVNINLTAGSIAGAGTFALGGRTLTVGGNNTSTSVTGTITGTGTLVKAGTGALTLSGAGNSAGLGYRVDAGILQVGGPLRGGSLTVNSGGRLTGTGTFIDGNGGTGLINNGTVAPGNSPGTLTVQGNYTQGPGGTLAIAITPTAAAQLRVIGTASLGGTLALNPASGSYLPDTRFTVLDADAFDPAANRFASVTNSGSAFVTFDVIYDDAVADVILSSRAVQGFRDVPGLSRNERAVAANADRLLALGNAVSADGQVVLGNLLSLSQGGFRRAAEEIAGESHPLTPTVLRATRTAFGGFVFDRLGAGSPALAADTDGLRYGWGTAAADRAAWQVAALDGAGGGGGGGGGGAAGIGRDGAWIRGFGLFGDIDSDARSAGADYRIGGFAAGIDRKITDRLTLGLAAGYARTDAEVKRDLGSFDVDSYQFALYGRQDLGQGWFVNGLLGGGVHEVEARRRISFAQLNRVTRSDHTDESFAAGLNIGRGLNLFGLDVTPTLGLRYDLLVQDRFRENGAGSLDLTVAGHDDNSLQLQSGVKLARSFALGGVTLRPELLLGYAHEFLDATQTLRVRQSEPGLSSRDVGGPEQDRDTALIGVNLAMQATDRFRLFLRYDGAFSGSAETNAVTGGIRYNW